VTVSVPTTVVPRTPPAPWRPSVIACSALRRITIGNLITRLRLIQIIVPIERQDLEIEHGCQIHKMPLDKPLELLKRRVIINFLVSIRVTGNLDSTQPCVPIRRHLLGDRCGLEQVFVDLQPIDDR
jgi:hypothetical protein